jgi:hypothetical protein
MFADILARMQSDLSTPVVVTRSAYESRAERAARSELVPASSPARRALAHAAGLADAPPVHGHVDNQHHDAESSHRAAADTVEVVASDAAGGLRAPAALDLGAFISKISSIDSGKSIAKQPMFRFADQPAADRLYYLVSLCAKYPVLAIARRQCTPELLSLERKELLEAVDAAFQTRAHCNRGNIFKAVDEASVLAYASRVLRRQLAALLEHMNPLLFDNLADADAWRTANRKLLTSRLERVQQRLADLKLAEEREAKKLRDAARTRAVATTRAAPVPPPAPVESSRCCFGMFAKKPTAPPAQGMPPESPHAVSTLEDDDEPTPRSPRYHRRCA